jgi:hypothetical protein
MANDHSDEVVQLLKEIRDLTKQRNEKSDAIVEFAKQRAENARKRTDALEVLAKKRFYVSIAAVFILGLMFFVVILLLMNPRQ